VAVGVLDYIAWHEPDLWREYAAVCIFGGGAVAFYWLHFGITFVREFGQTPDRQRDNYSGTSHASRLLKRLGIAGPAMEMNVHIWLEPALVLLAAAILRFAFAEQHLSAWLVIVAACMVPKELMNFWTEIRRGNIAEDIKKDAQERGEALGSDQPGPEAPQAARVAGQTIKRNLVLTEEEKRAQRLAEALGITEPYDLEEAESNYRDRIQLIHPDTHGDSPENNQRTVELNEAIEFFREKLGG
jgi:hypothetical protein